MTDPTPPPASPEQRALEESKRVLFPGPTDPLDAGHHVWSQMDWPARATGLLLLLLLRQDLRTDWVRYDRPRRIVYVVRPDPNQPGAQRSSSRPVNGSLDQILAVVRSQFGHRASEVERLVRVR